jgi:hypothetical protein
MFFKFDSNHKKPGLNILFVIPAAMDEICKIIGSHHSAVEINTQSFKILRDAGRLFNLTGGQDVSDKDRLVKMRDKKFLTDSGRDWQGRYA